MPITREVDISGTVTLGDEEYTKAIETKESDTEPTPFQIFWIVPDENYVVQMDVGSVHYQEAVSSGNLLPGKVFTLKGGAPIWLCCLSCLP